GLIGGGVLGVLRHRAIGEPNIAVPPERPAKEPGAEPVATAIMASATVTLQPPRLTLPKENKPIQTIVLAILQAAGIGGPALGIAQTVHALFAGTFDLPMLFFSAPTGAVSAMLHALLVAPLVVGFVLMKNGAQREDGPDRAALFGAWCGVLFGLLI